MRRLEKRERQLLTGQKPARYRRILPEKHDRILVIATSVIPSINYFFNIGYGQNDTIDRPPCQSLPEQLVRGSAFSLDGQ
jgi:hypothetical protein